MKFSVYIAWILLVSLSVYECQDAPEIVIYFTDPGPASVPGQIVKVHLHHMNFTILPLSNIIRPDAIDYDPVKEHIYWTDTSLKQIRRAGKDGENDTIVAQLNNASIPSGITLDSTTRQVFYTDMGDSPVIASIEMSTLSKTIVINKDLANPKGIVAFTKIKKLFWVDWGSDQKIQSCDYDGTNRRTVLSTGVAKPHGIAVDELNGRLYWADGVGHVETAFINGTGRRQIYTEGGVHFNDIAIFNSYLYLTMLNYQFLVALTENGGNLAILHSRSFMNPTGIHAFSPNFNITRTCEYGSYGAQCVKCGNCIDNNGVCEKTTGICLAGCQAGYQRDLCTEPCEKGTYGKSCDNECHNCREDTVCDIYTGDCPLGCRIGYMGTKCNISCGPNTYGNQCKVCGNCAGGDRCNQATGKCPNGCVDGFQGDQCETKCGPNTFGQCIPCGHCANGSACHTGSGYCPNGCQSGYEGYRCVTKGTPQPAKQRGDRSSGLAAGLGVGLGLLAVFALVGVAVFLWMRRKKAVPTSGVVDPVVKMARTPERESTNENDYTTIDTSGSVAIIHADELSHQTDMIYQNETQSSA